MADDPLLVDVLDSLRERGALGEKSLDDAVAHAELFVSKIPQGSRAVLDLGSGGGLPGLVLARHLVSARVVLTDRRERRTDLLRLACKRLGFDDRVEVRTGDVRDLARDGGLRGGMDVVTARAFGPPLWSLACSRPFLRDLGMVLISEPPSDLVDREHRWPPERVDALGFTFAEDVAETDDKIQMFIARPG